MVSRVTGFGNANWSLKHGHKSSQLFVQASLANIALLLGALTAGGGITGYVRTGSVPSVAAGVTVGGLVRSLLCIFARFELLCISLES
jgi:uncharacterized membrane protein (UPF0136 family)